MILAILGPHGAGKSTLGRALAGRLGWPFHEELGARLARSRPHGLDASHPQSAFDLAVARAERKRDLRSGPRARIVETWHPGNLAYAAHRNPELVPSLERLARTSAGAWPTAVIVVDADDATLAARQHEPGPPGFFARVGRDAETWAVRLGIPVAARVVTDDEPADVIVDRLLLELRSAL